MGMSNGVSLVQLLANARSSTVAAVVAHSGPRPRSLKNAEHPFPILLIVGSDDFAASSMQSDLDYYRSTGHDAELLVVDGLGHAWSTRNNAAAWRFLVDRRLINILGRKTISKLAESIAMKPTPIVALFVFVCLMGGDMVRVSVTESCLSFAR